MLLLFPGTPGSSGRKKTSPRRLLISGESSAAWMTPASTGDRLGAIPEQSTESNRERVGEAKSSCTLNAGRTPFSKGTNEESSAAGSCSCSRVQPLPTCSQCNTQDTYSNTCNQASTQSEQSHRQSAVSPGQIPVQSSLNSTFTCAEDGVFPLDSSDPEPGSTKLGTGDVPPDFQDQTIILSTPHVPKALHPHVNSSPAHINSSTVTKTKIADENTPPAKHRQVARAMDFENMPRQTSPGDFLFYLRYIFT